MSWAAKPRWDRAAPARSPSSDSSRNADRTRACRSCRRAPRDGHGKTASSRWDRIAAGGVSPGHVELAAAIEAHLANSRLAFRNGAAVPAGETAYAVIFQFFVERGSASRTCVIQDFSERRHGILYSYFIVAYLIAGGTTEVRSCPLGRPAAGFLRVCCWSQRSACCSMAAAWLRSHTQSKNC